MPSHPPNLPLSQRLQRTLRGDLRLGEQLSFETGGDLVAVDLGHPSLHPPTSLLKSVVYAMSPQAITDVWVHGRHVVKDQRVTTVDQGALMERVRTLTRGWAPA